MDRDREEEVDNWKRWELMFLFGIVGAVLIGMSAVGYVIYKVTEEAFRWMM